MTRMLLVLTLAGAWMALTNGFTLVNLLFGIALAAAAVFVLRADFSRSPALGRMGRIIALAGLFLFELVASAIRVAVAVMRPDLGRLKPAIIAVPLSVKTDVEITLLACLITLTPGTLSVDVSDDRALLFVHVLDLADKDRLIASIVGGFEKRIREIFA